MNILHPFSKLDSDSRLAKHFMPHQVAWIQAEKAIHRQRKQAVALAEKSVRIGWTYADAFKNVRKRLWFKNRDYLFATKDYPSALEYVRQCYKFAEVFDLTRGITSHGEESLSVNRLDEHGHPSSFTEEVKVGVIRFDNGSRIIAFSANPQAMSVYGGDVGLDEFAKHPNARLLWETAQARVTWNFDIAVWSSHDGEDTLFNEFAREAHAALVPSPHEETAGVSCHSLSPSSASPSLPQEERAGERRPSDTQHEFHPSDTSDASNPSDTSTSLPTPHSAPASENSNSALRIPHSALNCPWNIYFRVTLPDAIHFGLVDTINRARGTNISASQFLADCRARARDEGIFEQSYLCNPLGAAANHITEWSAIERCRADYEIERVHLEAEEVRQRFGEFNPTAEHTRERQIHEFLRSSFPSLFSSSSSSSSSSSRSNAPRPDAPRSHAPNLRLGFDVAASGQGDLAAIYLDEAKGDQLSLRALFTCRTEDWHFLKTVLFHFLALPNIQAAGDESGLGRQICWEAAGKFGSRFLKVNLATKKHDLGFALMNQLSVAEKRFPKSEADIAADFFALRKTHNGVRWAFSEGRNSLNPASHCDIAWAAALATHAHTERKCTVGAAIALDNGWFDGKEFHPYRDREYNSPAPPSNPNQSFPLGCGFCQHRPPDFNPPPARCQKCGIYLPKP